MSTIPNKWVVKSKKKKEKKSVDTTKSDDTSTFVMVRHAPMIKTLRGHRK